MAGSIFAGACVGLLLVLSHTFFVSGHLAQGSAQQKLHWSSIAGHPIRPALVLGVMPINPADPSNLDHHRAEKDALRLLSLVAFAAIAILLTPRSRLVSIGLITAMLMAIMGYIVLYKFDSAAVQPWYDANFFAPYSVLAGAACVFPSRLWKIAATIFVIGWACFSVRASLSPIWPRQEGFYRAGMYLHEHPEIKPVGAWNAGIEGYFAGDGVINLDGLVNDDVLPYTLSGSLPDYLRSRGIDHIVDDEAMIEVRAYRERGGYPGTSLTRCITSTKVLWPSNTPRHTGRGVSALDLDDACLGSRSLHP